MESGPCWAWVRVCARPQVEHKLVPELKADAAKAEATAKTLAAGAKKDEAEVRRAVDGVQSALGGSNFGRFQGVLQQRNAILVLENG